MGFLWFVLLVVVSVLLYRTRARLSVIERRVERLDNLVRGWLLTQTPAPQTPAVTSIPDGPPVMPVDPVVSSRVEAPPARETSPWLQAEPASIETFNASGPASPPPLPRAPAIADAVRPRTEAAPPPRPDPFTVVARVVRQWLTQGNVPVKVGMLVLFAGVAALLKYASDQGWMRVPVELKLAGIALAALGGLVFGWQQRERKRGFALSLQGGSIGVLLLVVFASFKLLTPPLLPAGAAFALSIVLVAGCGVLAVRQNAMALAVLAILAGFLAPIWLSTGSGNHVALFSYYALLNAGIFAIAWFRPWRVLNLLGFAFTFGIGTFWGVLDYTPAKFASTEPFLVLFFAFYLLIPILYARRRAAGRRDFVDGCLLFGTPLVAFTLQTALLKERMPLAFCALALAAIYAGLAWALRRREHFAPLVQPYALLAFGFATLAVPLALSASATASVFALEGAALVWLGLRQNRRLPQLSGAGLQLAAAISYAIGVGHLPDAELPVLNAACMGALLIALAAFWSAWSYRRNDAVVSAALPYYLWGLAWWLGLGLVEIDTFMLWRWQPAAWLLFAGATGALAAQWFRRDPAQALSITSTVALVSALLIVWWMPQQPLADWNGLSWLVFIALGWLSLRAMREHAAGELALAHSAWWLTVALVSSRALLALAQRGDLGSGWHWALAALPWLLLAAAIAMRPALIASSVGDRFDAWRQQLESGVLALMSLAACAALFARGDAQPLPWLPLLNPLELMQLATLGLVAQALYRSGSPLWAKQRVPALALAAFALLTVVVLRATHHWGGVPWSDAMFSTSLVQTSLTVTWSVLGVLGWIIGSRRGQRTLWLAGAVLMGVVLAKLVLVDRGHLGNLFGILSFLAYGLLCTAVGYFAPAPPKREDGLTEEQTP